MNSKLITKYWLDIFIYLSLILLIYYLLEADILFFPRLYSASSLFLSVILIIAGFLSEMYAWYYLLKEYGIKPRPITRFIGSGTAILGKYIPGKVWTVLGRAKVVAGEVNKGVTEISFISFESQIPLFHWGDRLHTLRATRKINEVALLMKKDAEEMIRLELEQSWYVFTEAVKKYDLCEKALIQASENLRMSQDSWQEGMIKLSDLLEAQVIWQQAYSELIQSKTDLKMQEINYRRKTGLPLMK